MIRPLYLLLRVNIQKLQTLKYTASYMSAIAVHVLNMKALQTKQAQIYEKKEGRYI